MGTTPAAAADYAAAFLGLGLGTQAAGMGSAYGAVAQDASAVFWNPAGLIRTPGIHVTTAIMPLSLDRLQNSVAAEVNMRGDLAFGCAWVHAGVDGIQGRTGSGAPTGTIDDSENAFLIAVARSLGSRLSLGLTLKILDQDLDVPGWNKAEATGHGVDVGAQLRLSERIRLAAVVRNLDAALEWKVERASTSQASSTRDHLQRSALLGAAVQLPGSMLLSLEVGQATDPYARLGAQWTLSPLLTVRAGASSEPDDESTPGSLSAGLTLRPMRTEALLLHYAFVTDQLDAGDRSIFGLSMSF